MVQKELVDVVQGTYRTVFDMCQVGGLKVPQGNNYLRSGYCTKQHGHCPIQGKMLVNGRWDNLSAFAAKYTRGFARNVIESVWCSKEGCELPMFQEELCVPCHGVHERDQQEAAEEILKRRRLNYKQAEEMASSNAGSSGSRVELPMALP